MHESMAMHGPHHGVPPAIESGPMDYKGSLAGRSEARNITSLICICSH
jgi:hypothetical protein